MNDEQQPRAEHQPTTIARVTLRDIFFLFFQIGSLSFGGGLVAWIYREVVERRKWLSESEFLSGFTLAQVLPGINMTNMAVYIGQRMRGIAGAVVGLSAMLLVPFFAVIGLISIYAVIETNLTLQSFMDGVATTAVGLFLSVGVKSLRTRAKDLLPLVIMAAVVAMVGFLGWPLIPVILCLAPLSVALAWRRGPAHA
jgi:chromate transporter